jgi:hypothetical protein
MGVAGLQRGVKKSNHMKKLEKIPIKSVMTSDLKLIFFLNTS